MAEQSRYDLWNDRLTLATQSRDARKDEWARNEALYSNTYENKASSEDKPRVNYARNNLQRFVAKTSLPDRPVIYCKPTREEAGDGRLEALVLNEWIRSTNFKEQYRWLQFGVPVHGVGFMRTGFDSRWTQKSAEQIDSERMAAIGEAQAENNALVLSGQRPKAKKFQRHPDHAEEHERQIMELANSPDLVMPIEGFVQELQNHIDDHNRLHEGRVMADYDSTLAEETAWAQWWHPREVLVDSDAISLEDAGWIAFGSYPLVRTLKEDKLNKNTDGIEGAAVRPRSDDRASNDGPVGGTGDSLAKVHRWEIYSKEDGGKYIVLVEGHTKLLRDEINPLAFMGRLPARVCRLSVPLPDKCQDGRQFYPEAEMSTWSHMQNMIDYVAARLINNVRKARTLALVSDATASEERTKVANAADLSIVPVQDVNQYREIQLGEVNETHLVALPILSQWMSDMSGINPVNRGSAQPKSHVATSQIQQIAAYGDELFVDNRGQMRTFLENVLGDVLMILQHFKDLPERVWDADSKQWVEWDRLSISPHVKIDIEIGEESGRQSKEQQQQQWMSLAGILPQLYQMLTALQLPPTLVAQILQGLLDSFSIRGADKIVESVEMAMMQSAQVPQEQTQEQLEGEMPGA